jgi:hypothetical protein
MSKEPSLSGFSNSQLRKLAGSGEYQKRLNSFNSTVDKSLINKQIKELDAKERYHLKMKGMRNNRLGSTGADMEALKEEVKTKVEVTKEIKENVKTKSDNKKYAEKMRKLNKKYGPISLEEYTTLKQRVEEFNEEQKGKSLLKPKEKQLFLSTIYKNLDEHYMDVNKVNLYDWQQTRAGLSVEEANKRVLGDIDEGELSDISDD